MAFSCFDLWNLRSFSIEAESLCEAQSCTGTFGLRAAAGSAPTSGYPAECRRIEVLIFPHMSLEEGGRAKRIENSELKVMVYPNIPFSVFCFGVWPERNFLSVFS